MTDEILKLGSQQVIVHATDKHAEVELAQKERVLAQELTEALKHDQLWCQESFANINATELMHTIQTVAKDLSRGQDLLPFELDAKISAAARKLSLTHKLLINWVMEVRVGLRSVWSQAKHLVAVSFMTPSNGLAYNKRVCTMGESYPLAVLHIASGPQGKYSNLSFRGYSARIDYEGNCQVGQRRGNIWLKNGWPVPGIRHISDVLAARTSGYINKRRYQRNNHELTVDDLSEREAADLLAQCQKIEARMHENRHDSVKEENFLSAEGRRLDLENVAMMTTFLSLVRSLRAKAAYEQYDRLLDRVVSDTGYYKTDIIADPSLAGDMADVAQRYIKARDMAAAFHHYVGDLTLPAYYVAFSPTTLPRALEDVELISMEGTGARCMSMADLAERTDRSFLLNSPAAVGCVENFDRIVRHFGVLCVYNKPVLESVEEFRVGEDSYDSNDEAVAALNDKYAGQGLHIERCVAFRLYGEDNIRELPAKEFRSIAKFKLVPQVLVHRRGGAELNFFKEGVYASLSTSQINSKFKSWKKNG